MEKRSSDRYVVPVQYGILPAFAELEKSFDVVDEDFLNARFERSDLCKELVPTEGEHQIVLELTRLDAFDVSNGCLDLEMAERDLRHRGVRPAVFEELLAFSARYPKIPGSIVALGSVTRDDDFLLAPGTDRTDFDFGYTMHRQNGTTRFVQGPTRYINLHLLGGRDWFDDESFLVVRI